MRNRTLEEAKKLRAKIEDDTFVDSDGCLRWNMGNAVPSWTWEEAYGEKMPGAFLGPYNRDVAAFLDDYRKNDSPPDAEQLYEMRAAFGEGETVVNVFTGRETKL
jgi:hypothetical protein